MQTKLESMEYKLKFSEDKNNETIKSLKSMNDILLKRENENKDILMKSIELNESLKRSNSSSINNSNNHAFEDQTDEEKKFKSKYHKHQLTYRKNPNYNIARCDICKRTIYDIKTYNCIECEFDMCPTCKSIEEIKDLILISTPLHEHSLEFHGNKNNVRCDLCNNKVEPYNSYRCNGCDFDACEKCIRSYKWPSQNIFV